MWPIGEAGAALGEYALCQAKSLLHTYAALLAIAKVTGSLRKGDGLGECARAVGGTIPPPRNALRFGR
jgi:hypothetical protein